MTAPTDMSVASVQRGQPQAITTPRGSLTTGIMKEPVSEITVAIDGVVGDAVVNQKHHGGPDQAVYLYGADDYAWWNEKLGRSFTPGGFGDNVTVSTFGSAPLRVGDQLIIGDVTLEVTAPRVPCGTLAARVGIDDFVAQFRAAGRLGAYTRVQSGGTIAAGAPIEHVRAPDSNVTIDEVFDLYYDRSSAVLDRLRVALDSPVAARVRADFENRLAKA